MNISSGEEWADQWNRLVELKRQTTALQQAEEDKKRQADESQRYDDITGANNEYLLSLKNLVNNPGAAMQNNPFFKWQQQQGEQAVSRQAAAQGQNYSGNKMMALSDYAQKQSGNNYFALADLYKTLGQQGVGNKQAFYGIKNQTDNIMANAADSNNRIALARDQFEWGKDQASLADMYAKDGWKQSRRDANMAKYGGKTSSDWFNEYLKAFDNDNKAYADYAIKQSRSAPLFF